MDVIPWMKNPIKYRRAVAQHDKSQPSIRKKLPSVKRGFTHQEKNHFLSVRLSAGPYTCSIRLCLSACRSVRQSVRQPVRQPVSQSVCLSVSVSQAVSQSVSQSVSLSVCPPLLSVRRSTFSVRPSVSACLSVRLSLCHAMCVRT